MGMGGQVALVAGVDDERALARAAQHERRAESGGTTADDDAVIGHAPTVAHRGHNLPSFLAELANDLDTHVRRRLRELRTERGLTLEAVAAQAQIDVSTSASGSSPASAGSRSTTCPRSRPRSA